MGNLVFVEIDFVVIVLCLKAFTVNSKHFFVSKFKVGTQSVGSWMMWTSNVDRSSQVGEAVAALQLVRFLDADVTTVGLDGDR